MKQLMNALKSARRIEIWIIIVMLCVLLVLGMGRQEGMESVSSDEELRLQRLLSRIEGAGRVAVMLSGSMDGSGGCVVVSSGAEDVRVMLELQHAVQALTGLQLDRIEIVKSE